MLWKFTILPAVVLNIASFLLFGTYYALQSIRPDAITYGESDLLYILYVMIVVVEWAFFVGLYYRLQRQGLAMSALLRGTGAAEKLSLLPAVTMFVAFNGLFAAYIWFVNAYMDGWPEYSDWGTAQTLFMILVVPLTAAITEEFIWRGYILRSLLERTTAWRAILLSALSFAFIHGLMPDRLLVTFLIGVVAGYYYYRERRLLPLIFAHLFLDVWSFGITAF